MNTNMQRASAPLSVPTPTTRLEAAHEKNFRALVRLRDMTSRANAIARHLVGDPPPNPPGSPMSVSASGLAGNSSSNVPIPLVRRIEETGDFLNEAIDDIEEALDRIGTL